VPTAYFPITGWTPLPTGVGDVVFVHFAWQVGSDPQLSKHGVLL
jgi:hypothetical protein